MATARQPQAAVFLLVQPVLFVLMFRYVFGGAITTPDGSYVDFLMPGIFTQTMIFGGIATAVALSEDMSTGFLDRVRSLPVSRGAFLTGRVLADSSRNVVSILLMAAVGVAVGFRPELDVLNLLGAMGLLLAVGVAFLWFYAWLGLRVSTPEAAQAASFPLVFPLVFVSSVFVPTQSMPSWLQAFAENQPVSVTAEALRGLLLGGEVQGPLLQSLAWAVAIGSVFAFLSIRRYRRA
jgi:ABC-2 type transport system permease protein/oleandomycin transport system permease protein